MKTLLLLACFASLASSFAAETFSSLDKPPKNPTPTPTASIALDNAGVEEAFKLYQSISGRTVVRPATNPATKITLRTEGPVTPRKALQLLDTALSQHDIVMIPQGADVVKAVPYRNATTEAVPVCELTPDELPESNSYTHYILRLKSRSPRELAQILQPLAKFPNSIMSSEKDRTIMLRDYAVNIRRMLQVIQRLDKEPDTREGS
jgi:type II secretory pathway component GspD/PulD (secretin)